MGPLVTRIEHYQYLLFVWRCFGDGIANIYQSKYALKHLFFSAKDYSIKERPGFITGKAGFDQEWNLLNQGVRAGVPVILCDLTNVLRYGDVCALAGPDPVPIEVKSSRNRNARVQRQVQQLSALSQFFSNDGAREFRGVSNVKRRELRLQEVNHIEAINICIQQALTNGFATAAPEPGLRYIASLRGDLRAQIESLLTPATLVTALTPMESWQTCYPFTLSLTPSNLLSFVQGDIVVLVLTDLKFLKTLFAKQGIHATMLMDGASAIQICPDPGDLYKGVFRISENLFSRIALEFQSLAWFAAEYSLIFDGTPPPVLDIADLPSLAGVGPVPDEWWSATDCFETESSPALPGE